MEKHDNKKAVAFSRKISQQQLEKIFPDFLNVPMADVLIELFVEAADPQTFRLREMPHTSIIYAGPKTDNIQASFVLERVSGKFEWLNLRIYNGPLERIPAHGLVSPDCLEIVSISAGPVKMGNWKPGKGNEITYAILVHQHGAVSLPTESGKWLYNLLYRLALLANEFHLDISDQPRFWEKEDRFGENKQPEDLPGAE